MEFETTQEAEQNILGIPENTLVVITKEGTMPEDDGGDDEMAQYFIGEIYWYLTLKAGFVYANGQVLQNVEVAYPKLMEWINDASASGGAQFVVDQATWEAEWDAIADEEWEPSDTQRAKIGLCSKYVYDSGAHTLQIPDFRGAYVGGAGYEGMSPASVSGDTIRPLTAETGSSGGGPTRVGRIWTHGPATTVSGVFTYGYDSSGTDVGAVEMVNAVSGDRSKYYIDLNLDVSSLGINVSLENDNPTGVTIKPRTLALYPCIFVGA
jgi:hypothetical protein